MVHSYCPNSRLATFGQKGSRPCKSVRAPTADTEQVHHDLIDLPAVRNSLSYRRSRREVGLSRLLQQLVRVGWRS